MQPTRITAKINARRPRGGYIGAYGEQNLLPKALITFLLVYFLCSAAGVFYAVTTDAVYSPSAETLRELSADYDGFPAFILAAADDVKPVFGMLTLIFLSAFTRASLPVSAVVCGLRGFSAGYSITSFCLSPDAPRVFAADLAVELIAGACAVYLSLSAADAVLELGTRGLNKRDFLKGGAVFILTVRLLAVSGAAAFACTLRLLVRMILL